MSDSNVQVQVSDDAARATMTPAATDTAPVETPVKAEKKTRKPAAAKKVPADKKKSGKKPAKAATKSSERFSPADVKLFDKAFTDWTKGAKICDLAAPMIKSGLITRRGSLRRQLRKRAGGKEAFVQMRSTGAGGIRQSLGERPVTLGLDKGAKLIPVGGRKDWTKRHVGELVVHMAGKGGAEYVTAGKDQPAVALAQMGNGLPPMRLVKFTAPKIQG